MIITRSFFHLATHCTEPPTPPMSSGLVPDWDGGLIDFNSDIEFKCQNGQKFLNDFDKTSQKSMCQPENLWTSVSWGQCVESKNFSNVDLMNKQIM